MIGSRLLFNGYGEFVADLYPDYRFRGLALSELRDFDPGRFVTLCCARVCLPRRELTYVSAGHPEPILRKGDEPPVLLEST